MKSIIAKTMACAMALLYATTTLQAQQGNGPVGFVTYNDM